ncbi:MAG: DUF983 domain-containing protein [Bacteroidia bacterium]
MSKPPGWFVSMLSQKCPHCRSENAFYTNTYSWKFLKMHRHCPNCNMDFEPEPGFYWAAMYITYGFNTGLSIVVSLILFLFFDNPEMWVYVSVIVGLVLILIPPFIRYSRMILLYGLGGKKFDPDKFKRN